MRFFGPSFQTRLTTVKATATATAAALAVAAAASTAAFAPVLARAETANPAAAKAETYTPMVGQEGKDVVWVPTPQALVDRMLDMAKVTPRDRLVDLGSGDGITVITAAKRGIRARGIEYNPDMVALSQQRAKEAGVQKLATFERGDIFEADFSEATVVTLFLLPNLNVKLRPILLDMKPGTRVVANSFNMGEWEADETAEVTQDCESYCRALMWIVPAKVEGTWALGDKKLAIQQNFQKFEGTLGNAAADSAISEGRLQGAKIEFTVDGDKYVGELKGDRMQGTVNGKRRWEAKKAVGA